MDYVIKMKASLEYIDQNLTGDVSLETLAERAYLSKYHFHRLFRKSFGEGVSRYVNKKRMECAAKELIESDQPIIDIALKYQYSSQEAFSRAFKRIYQITPGNYRRTYSYQQQNNIISLCSYHRNAKTMAA